MKNQLRSITVGTAFSVVLFTLSFSGSEFVSADTFPDLIPLPNGFQPEGIAVGRGSEFFVGSLGRLGDDGMTITVGPSTKEISAPVKALSWWNRRRVVPPSG